jgi:hypothetical protein
VKGADYHRLLGAPSSLPQAAFIERTNMREVQVALKYMF